MTEFDRQAGQNHDRIAPMGLLADLPGGGQLLPQAPHYSANGSTTDLSISSFVRSIVKGGSVRASFSILVKGVAMDSLKYRLGPPSPTVLRPADGDP
jgi:hypothetical protein